MMEQLATWWRARTERERLLLQVGLVLLLVIALPLLLLQSANAYRARAGADLASASSLLTQVQTYAAARAQPAQGGAPSSDGTPRGEAVATAQALGLTISRIEASGADRARVVFEPGDSRAMLRWLERMTRAGIDVRATRMLRVSGSESVQAEFEIGGGP